MCGRVNVLDNPALRNLYNILGVEFPYPDSFSGINIKPTDPLYILQNQIDGGDSYEAVVASWWLLQTNLGDHIKPLSKYASFNSRANKLLETNSSHYRRPYSYRVLIPVTGFHEWVGLSTKKQVYNITGDSGWLLFAGVAKAYETNNGVFYSTSVVTLPSHQKFHHIHSKSIPMMLRPEDVALWLDPRQSFQSSMSMFNQDKLQVNLAVTPIHSVTNLIPTGTNELILSG